MTDGITNIQLASLILSFSGSSITTLIYLLQYDKGRHSKIASQAESSRWETVKKEYGKLVSSHHAAIENSANLFLNWGDPEGDNPKEYAETMAELLDNTDEFTYFRTKIAEMEQPKTYHRRCRLGAEYAPWIYFSALVIGLIPVLFDLDAILPFVLLSALVFLGGVVLTITFLYYRSKMNGLADEVQFET